MEFVEYMLYKIILKCEDKNDTNNDIINKNLNPNNTWLLKSKKLNLDYIVSLESDIKYDNLEKYHDNKSVVDVSSGMCNKVVNKIFKTLVFEHKNNSK